MFFKWLYPEMKRLVSMVSKEFQYSLEQNIMCSWVIYMTVSLVIFCRLTLSRDFTVHCYNVTSDKEKFNNVPNNPVYVVK
jgi:hypothetical protein